MFTSRARAHLALVMVISTLFTFVAIIYQGRESARPQSRAQIAVQPSPITPQTAIALSRTPSHFAK